MPLNKKKPTKQTYEDNCSNLFKIINTTCQIKDLWIDYFTAAISYVCFLLVYKSFHDIFLKICTKWCDQKFHNR